MTLQLVRPLAPLPRSARVVFLLGLALGALPAAASQRFPACGIPNDRWSTEDAAEEFYILSALEGERAAAEWYERRAVDDPHQAMRFHRLAALASERAIADLAAAAILFEERGQLRLARNARTLKDQHRERAERSWASVERLGGFAQRDGVARRFACTDSTASDSETWRLQAERQFRTAEDVLDRGEPPYSVEQIREWAVLVVLGADALVTAGCAGRERRLEDLLEATQCFLAAAPSAGTDLRSGDIYAKAAATLRAIALERAKTTD